MSGDEEAYGDFSSPRCCLDSKPLWGQTWSLKSPPPAFTNFPMGCLTPVSPSTCSSHPKGCTANLPSTPLPIFPLSLSLLCANPTIPRICKAKGALADAKMLSLGRREGGLRAGLRRSGIPSVRVRRAGWASHRLGLRPRLRPRLRALSRVGGHVPGPAVPSRWAKTPSLPRWQPPEPRASIRQLRAPEVGLRRSEVPADGSGSRLMKMLGSIGLRQRGGTKGKAALGGAEEAEEGFRSHAKGGVSRCSRRSPPLTQSPPCGTAVRFDSLKEQNSSLGGVS